MRDKLGNEEDINIINNFYKKRIEKVILQINDLYKNQKEDNHDDFEEKNKIIYNFKNELIKDYYCIICSSYSMGEKLSEIDEYYKSVINFFEEIGTNFRLYTEFIQLFILGLILEMPKDRMQKIVDIADKNEYDDILFDFYAKSYGLKRKFNSTKMIREVPYKGILEIAKLTQSDKEKAEKKLSEYILKKWIKGYSDENWSSAHNRFGYVGLWSFDAGLVAKIFSLDDSSLKDNNHYPYELVHYKNNVVYENIEVPQFKEDDEVYETGIAENPELEKLIAAKFHKPVNQLIEDFKTLSDKEMFEKYELIEIFEDFQIYKDYDKNNVLGFLVLSILVRERYVMQLDFKDNIKDFKQYLKSYWGKTKTKLISFKVNNDQQYFAYVPKDCDVTNLYEIEIQ